MNHPEIMQSNAKLRYDGMLEAAETHRRVKRLPRQNTSLRARILSIVSDVFAATVGGFKLERRTDAKLATLND